MSKQDDGGTAFPATEADHGLNYGNSGMSLRDYFAAAAIKGGAIFHQEDGCGRDPKESAEIAYQVADAMLAERAK